MRSGAGTGIRAVKLPPCVATYAALNGRWSCRSDRRRQNHTLPRLRPWTCSSRTGSFSTRVGAKTWRRDSRAAHPVSRLPSIRGASQRHRRGALQRGLAHKWRQGTCMTDTAKATDPYARDTQFRCAQGHGVWRRDQLPVRRGSLVCPVGLREACICGLKMEETPCLTQ